MATKTTTPSGVPSFDETIPVFPSFNPINGSSSSPVENTPAPPPVMDVADFDAPTPNIPVMETSSDIEKDAIKLASTTIGATIPEKTEETKAPVDTAIQDLIDKANLPSATEMERADLVDKFKTTQESLTEKSTRLAEEEKRLGLEEKTKQLSGINKQIAQLQAGLQMGIANEEAKPIARQFITGRTAEMRRQASAEIGGLALVAQALQGDITLAQQTAQRTVDLEFAPQEQRIANLTNLINLNYQDLTRADKKRADEVLAKAKVEQAKIDGQKQEKLDILSLGVKNPQAYSEAKIDPSKDTLQDAIIKIAPFLEEETENGQRFTKIGSTTDRFGVTKDIFGFVNEAAGTVTNLQGSNVTTSPDVSISPTEGSVSFRTNNPGNIKWTGADWQKALGATNSGIKATDGGSFALFPSIEAGEQAQAQLLQAPSYANLTIDAAMKRWSNSGYGAEVSSIKADTKMKDLTPVQMATLMADMKKREGFYAPSTKQTTGVNNISEITGKPLSAAERQAQAFGKRMTTASAVIDKLESKFVGKLSGLASFLPGALKNEERKSLEQAQRNFVNAILRQESGAAIGKDEFDSAKSQYFPEAGDTELVLEQKAMNRKTVIEGMLLSGGVTTLIQPTGEIEAPILSDDDAYQEYLNTINQQ
jgi:hypothetical protein